MKRKRSFRIIQYRCSLLYDSGKYWNSRCRTWISRGPSPEAAIFCPLPPSSWPVRGGPRLSRAARKAFPKSLCGSQGSQPSSVLALDSISWDIPVQCEASPLPDFSRPSVIGPQGPSDDCKCAVLVANPSKVLQNMHTDLSRTM